jgi:hypothetical protein
MRNFINIGYIKFHISIFFYRKQFSNQRIQYNYNVFKMGRRLLLIINRENEKEKVK